MNTIKNIHLVANLIAQADLEKLETGAAMHRRHARIEFKIIEVFDTELHIRATQGKSPADNLLTQAELVTKTRELFAPFFPGRTIYVHATPYADHFTAKVNDKWLSQRMIETGTKAKDLIRDTGIDKVNVSQWLSGARPMSQITKAMLYYYFLHREQSK